jgi:1-acyl-sn-glycerol-3-phosphate acyltransferase
MVFVPWFSVSVDKHGRLVSYPVCAVRVCLQALWFFAMAAFGSVICLIRFRSPSTPAILCRIYAPVATWLAGIRIVQHDWHHTQGGPAVFVANQQSVFDLAVFGQPLPPNIVCVSKRSLLYYPFLGAFLFASGNIFIDRQNNAQSVEALDEAVVRLKSGEVSLWIYPEGTRNRTNPETLLPFKKGPFHTAVKSGRPIVPLVCSNQTVLMDPARGVWRGGTLVVRALPPIDVTGKSVNELHAQTRQMMQLAMDEINAEATKLNGGDVV